MGAVCGVSVESDAVRISYFRDGQRIEDSIDAEGARWLLSGKLADCGPFEDVVLTGRDSDVVESLLASLDTRNISTVRMVDEGAALLAYARSIPELASARSLLVLDLGRHGTTTLTLDVVRSIVTSTARRSALSGDSLDGVVERIVMDKDILPPAQGPEGEREYRDFFRELKELVTESAGVRAPNNGPMLLTRDEFEEAIAPTVLQTLAWAAPESPDAVLLIGGGARIPLVRALVEQEFDVAVVVPADLASVTAQGAALAAVPAAPATTLDALLDDHRDTWATPEPMKNGQGEPATSPIRIHHPAPVDEPTEPTEPTEPSADAPVAESVIGSVKGVVPSAGRRRIRWSVRDAAGLVGVVALVLLVWAVVYVRGDTPPPPGIGVDPATVSTVSASVVPAAPVAPVPEVPGAASAPMSEDSSPSDTSFEDTEQVDGDFGGGGDFDDGSFGGTDFGDTAESAVN